MPHISDNSANISAINMAEQGSKPTQPDTGEWKIYFKSDGIYIEDDGGAETKLALPSDLLSSVIDAKGDLLAGTADNTADRLAVGTDGQVLVADSSQATGLNWTDEMKDAGFYTDVSWGVSGAPFTSADQHSAAAAVTDAPTAGQKIVIVDLFVSVDTAMLVTFTCETSGAVIEKLYLPANGSAQVTFRGKKKLATADKKLMVLTSVAGNIVVDCGYYSEA